MGRGLIILVVTFLAGFAAGVAASVLSPRFATPYLPQALLRQPTVIEGEVLRKQRERDRVLLKIQTAKGDDLLVTFTQKVPEVDLLVEQGDRVTLAAAGDAPFLEDPEIERVGRQVSRPPGAGPPPQ